ncbi:MAG: cysteine-rich CWC family protein [Candidatus Acidiferrales bacterium]
MTRKECPACGASFGCSADSAGCWCQETKLTCEILAALRARHADCLCPRCLAAAAQSELQAHISIMNPTYESSDVRRHQYLCGRERDDDAREVNTQWVRCQNSPFSSPSTRLSRSISKAPASLPTAARSWCANSTGGSGSEH